MARPFPSLKHPEASPPVSPSAQPMPEFLAGVDVGSTTVKTVVRSGAGGSLLLHDYRRHDGRQAETVLSSLQKAVRELGIADNNLRLLVTGSGGQQLARTLGARFVQEVAAVSLAVERLYPQVHSVIELGGQDAKIILLQDGDRGGRRKIATMNDKCAGGTGVVIERIAARLHISMPELLSRSFDDAQIYPVAGKCGVFAETDITGLQKQGVPADHLMGSLFRAIVLQNLTVLTRGHALSPQVFLLGGPNAYFPGLQVAWRRELIDLWKRRNTLREDISPEELVCVPPLAEYFAAMGAILFGLEDSSNVANYQGLRPLERLIERQQHASTDQASGTDGLCRDPAELEDFRRTYAVPPAFPAIPSPSDVGVYIGLDGGSTSTKAVALAPDGSLVASSYRLSQSDPVSDAVAVLRDLRRNLDEYNGPTEVLGVGTTGYSKDLLKKVLSADVALVETVAHAESSLRLFPDVDAIVDVGGQDIKIILLQNGAVKDFRLNTQCSAGNGYFLQAAAEGLGLAVEDFAAAAFRARRMPVFSYGCAVFLQTDIVNFQRQGWMPEEILAGLAAVLPKNIFLYVAGVANVAGLGRRFVLQGGTQRNLAVVKAEVDFILEHYHGAGLPEIRIHPHCCEAGAIGAALEAIKFRKAGQGTRFPGFAMLDSLQYTIRRDETTRCHFCTNRCLRTFVDLSTAGGTEPAAGHVIIANCERGEAQDAAIVREINAEWNALRNRCPNYVHLAAEQAWQPTHPRSATTRHKSMWSRRTEKTMLRRSSLHIGIPRGLNLFTYAPLFSAWFESLGVPAENLCYSHFSRLETYQQAAGFSAVDPCFPAKVSLAHVYELLRLCKSEHLDAIFFPMFDVLTTPLRDCGGSNACPSGAATPEAVKAAFSRSSDWFRNAGVLYVNPVLNLADRDLFKFQMYSAWKNLLGLDWGEHARAVDIAFEAWSAFETRLRGQARKTLDELESSGRIGLVMLGRPYHHDPGLNHGILEEFQRLGYPVFSQSLLPLDPDLLNRLFWSDLRTCLIQSPTDISDVWKHTFSASSNHKIWAAKFVARHPNLIPVELSNFKCGHDAFISRVVEQIIEKSGKPHFAFRDLDENRPVASIRIRIETMHYFLRQYQERLQKLEFNGQACDPGNGGMRTNR